MKMKIQKRVITFFPIIMFGLIGSCHVAIAETKVSGEEITTLLSGNTVEGKFIMWNTTYKAYFEATGKLRRIDSLNNKESGEWFIESDKLCIKTRKKRCGNIMKRDDGGYNAYRAGNFKYTFDKIVPGNPHIL